MGYKLNCPEPVGAVELKKWVKLSLKNKALRHRQKIFTTNNHYEWSKNQSCRICHNLTPGPSPEERGLELFLITSKTKQNISK